MLPYALSIGISYNDFWDMTLKQFRIHEKGHNLKLKEIDKMNWYLGQYIYMADLAATDNCLNGRKSRAKYADKPFLQDVELDTKTEEEQLEDETKKEKLAAEKTFLKLKVMEANFNLRKEREAREKQKENEGDT